MHVTSLENGRSSKSYCKGQLKRWSAQRVSALHDGITAARAVMLIMIVLPICPPAVAQELGRFEANGVVISESDATISSSMSARIDYLEVRLGDSFAEGDILIRFDCGRTTAELRAAESAAAAALARLEINEELGRRNAVGRGNLLVSKADADEALARVQAAEELAKHCEIAAPFSGRVAEKFVNRHETPREGEAIIRIVDNRNLAVELIVPSTSLRWIAIGTRFEFEIMEIGTRLEAEIESIGAEVDPVSQTVGIRGRFLEDIHGVLPGMSGRAFFGSD